MLNASLRQRLGVGTAVGCVILALAACGSEPSSSATTPVPTSTAISTTATTAAATTTQASAAPTSSVSTAPTTVAVDPPTSAEPTTPATGEPAAVAEVADQRASIAYDHPDLGALTITIAYPERTDASLIDPTIRATVDASGETVFEWGEFGLYYEFGFAGTGERNPTIDNPVDKRGHVFFEYELERGPGVVYLVPTTTGFESGPDPAGVQHNDATIFDSDGDGNYEIEQGFYVCTSSCADGYGYTHIWTWDGSVYTGSTADPNLSDADLAQQEAAKQTFADFFSAIADKDYERAWAMMTESAQAKYGELDAFKNYWTDADGVGTDSMRAYKITNPPNPDASTAVEAELSYTLSDGTRQQLTVTATMTDDNPPKIDAYDDYG